MDSVQPITISQKISFFLLCAIILTFFISGSAYSHEQLGLENDFSCNACVAEKVYVEYSNIFFDEAGILINDCDCIMPVDEIGCDANGFTFMQEDQQR